MKENISMNRLSRDEWAKRLGDQLAESIPVIKHNLIVLHPHFLGSKVYAHYIVKAGNKAIYDFTYRELIVASENLRQALLDNNCYFYLPWLVFPTSDEISPKLRELLISNDFQGHNVHFDYIEEIRKEKPGWMFNKFWATDFIKEGDFHRKREKESKPGCLILLPFIGAGLLGLIYSIYNLLS